MKHFLSRLAVLSALFILNLVSFSLYAVEKVVGDGQVTSCIVPFYTNHLDHKQYSYNQLLYTASEIGLKSPTTINAIAFYVSQSSSGDGGWSHSGLTIYMGHKNGIFENTSDYVEDASLTKVFEEDYGVLGGTKTWNKITLDTPFEYDGQSNLVVVVARKCLKGEDDYNDFQDNIFNCKSFSTGGYCLYRVSSTYPDVMQNTSTRALTMENCRPNLKIYYNGGTPVSSITISGPTSVNRGETIQLTATCQPSTADEKTVTWSSSNTSIAQITPAGGYVSGLSVGSVTITATANDGSGVKATYTVSVNSSHILTRHPAQAATCAATGNREYWSCSHCTTLFADANAETTTTLAAVTIPAKGHSYGSSAWTWATNGKSATAKFTCSVCNDTQTKTATITSAVKIQPTCSTKGTTTYTAKVSFNNKEYSSTKDVQDIPTTAHSYNMSGKCTVCGNQLTFDSNGFSDLGAYYQEPTLSNGYYQIANGGNLYWFAASGHYSANAKLTKDIVVNSNVLDTQGKPQGTNFREWIPIGKEDHEFEGTFDGNNHSISGLYLASNDSEDEDISVFGCCINANVKNLTIKDSYFCGMQNVSGIVGSMYGGQVFNCHNYSTAEIKGSMSYLGGIVASCNNAEIRNCSNYGLLISSCSRVGFVGGICGAALASDSSVSIVGCSNFGNITDNKNTAFSGGIVCDLTSYSEEIGVELPANVEFCYNVGNIEGKLVGAIACSLSSGSSANYCVAKEGSAASLIGAGELENQQGNVFLSDFSSGAAAYILNGKINAGTNWFQNLDNGKTVDPYPVLDDSHGIVYLLGDQYSNSNKYTITITDPAAYTRTEQIGNVDVTYSRNFSTTNWQALYVPFEIDYDLIKDELEVGRINAFYQYDDDEDGDPDRFSLEFFKMKDGATLRANYPYLVKAKTTGKKTFTFENVTLHKAESNFIDCATVDTRFILTGVYELYPIENNETYFLTQGAIKNITQGSSISPMRWYVRLEDRTGSLNPNKAKARSIELIEGGYTEESEATSIQAYSIMTSNAIYNMNGTCVGYATETSIADEIKKLPSGIYIYKGKKYTIK